MADTSDASSHGDAAAVPDTRTSDGPAPLSWVPRLGVWAWSFVLVVTALGGLVGGIVGLMLAVPATVIARTAIARLRSTGVIERVADRAKPTARRMLG